MPIRFRCEYCDRLLGIARRKAGTETTCPHCGYAITVPEADAKTEMVDAASMDEIDAMLNPESATLVDSPPAPPAPPSSADRPRTPPAASRSYSALSSRPVPTQPNPGPTPAAAPVPAAAPNSHPPVERPLFERDVDAVLGGSSKPLKPVPDSRHKLPATSGMDAKSLGPEPGQIVLSTQRAAAIAIAVVVLLALSFAAGFLVASR